MTGPARTTVVVVDDHPLYRDGLSAAITGWPELKLVGEAGDGRAGLALLREQRPDVAIVDVQLPELSGLEVLAQARREGLAARILLLSAFTESALVYEAVAAGAAGYLDKNTGRREICDAIVAVARGETVLSPHTVGCLAGEVQRRQEPAHASLSTREAQVLVLVADGCTTAEVGRRLHLSPTTVKTHLRSIFRKLGVSDRAAAVAEALRNGLLS